MNKLLLSLAVTFLLITQACKKKEEEPAAPSVNYVENVVFDNANALLNDLTTGKSYTIDDAIQNADKIDITYLKVLPFVNTQNQADTAYQVVLSPTVITFGGSSPFSNKTTFAPLRTATTLKDITDVNQLKTLYDEAVASFGSESTALSGIGANATIMFKIRQQTSSPKYGGFVVNSISSDSLKLNVSIVVQE